MDQEQLEEIKASEYIVFLLALDTYFRYLGDSGLDPRDPHMIAGVKLLRRYDQSFLPMIVDHMTSLLPTDGQKRMIQKAATLTPDRTGLPKRALYFRTALDRGGAATVSALYKTNKYKAAVRLALSASVNENADAALDVFASLDIPNNVIEAWIKEAARIAVPRGVAVNPVTAATTAVVDQQPSIVETQVKGEASDPTSSEVGNSKAVRDAQVAEVQVTATEKAKEALEKSGEADVAPTKSEVIGIAAAMIAAQQSSGDASLPPAVRRLSDPEQRDVVMSTGRVVVQAGAGSGKCVVGKTLVRTSEGWIRIQDFAEGLTEDTSRPLEIFVQGVDGPEKTSAIYRDGYRKTYKVVTRYGYKIEGTGKHPILVLRGGEHHWVKLSEVEEGDFVCIDRRPGLFAESPFKATHTLRHADKRIAANKFPEELTPQVASFLGYVVSEGSVSVRHGIQVSTSDSAQLELTRKPLLEYGVPHSVSQDKRNGVYSVNLSAKANVDALFNFGLSPSLAHEKSVPEGILRSPKKVVREFLRALFDGDGSVSGPTVSYASASEDLIRDVQELLLGFGVISKTRFKDNDKRGCWELSITGSAARLFLREIGFNLASKQARGQSILDTPSNTNVDVVPGVHHLFLEARQSVRDNVNITTSPNYSSYKSVLGGTRNPSRSTIAKFLEDVGGSSSPEAEALNNLQKSPWFYDPVVDIEEGEGEVYDFVVPGTHSFSAGGFVNHNTTSVVAMLQYLTEDQKVAPEKIFVGVFNVKAAATITERAKKLMGDDKVRSMNLGTMHSRFLRAIIKYGNADDRDAFTKRLISDRSDRNPRPFITPAQISAAMVAVWKGCFGDEPLPKGVSTQMEKWKFNDISPDRALGEALDDNERRLARWYKWQQGFKGLLGPQWTPDCISKTPPPRDNYGNFRTTDKAAAKWWGFVARYRTEGNGPLGSKVLADHTDMILKFRDILRDNPGARREVQSQYSHIIFDEAQDLSAVAHQIADYMSEHIDVDSQDKLLMFIGDTNQAVNSFVGGSPKHMADRYESGFKLKTIRTNHRCLPEIVEAANRLMANHPKTIPFEAAPDPVKPRGEASINVMSVPDQSIASQSLIDRWSNEVAATGGDFSRYAVLSRTRRELDTYELGCILNGVPYSRKGGGSFLQSPEMKTVMGYMNIATSNDYKSLKKSLSHVLNTPNRFFLKGDVDVEQIVDKAVNSLARRNGTGVDQINPLDLLSTRQGIASLVESLGIPNDWRGEKAASLIEQLGYALENIRNKVARNTVTPEGKYSYPTADLIDDILNIEGAPEGPAREQKTVTVKDVLVPQSRQLDDEDGANQVLDPEEAALGTVYFLKTLAVESKAMTSKGMNSSNPDDFVSYIRSLNESAKDLRVNADAWDREQEALFPDNPELRKKAPAVTLSTIHSIKGAEWPDTSVVMTHGTFPFIPRPIPGEENLNEEQRKRLAERREEEFLTERQLAYVAMTRASEKLTVVSQTRDSKGRRIPPSTFILEAGLVNGENVKGQPEAPPVTEETVRTASFYVGDYE